MIQIRDRLKDLKEKAPLGNISSIETDSAIEMKELEEEIEFISMPHPNALGNLLKKYTNIKDNLFDIEEFLIQMQYMASAIHATDFNQKEFDKVRRDSIQLNNSIVKRFKKLEGKLPESEDYSALARIKRLLYHGFFQQYVILWSKNEKFLMEYEENAKKKLKMQSQILNCNLTDEDIETMFENKNTNLFVSNILQDIEAERKTLQELKDRFEDLKKMEKSITEVHNLFISLQTLVSEQNEIMQHVETHFDATRHYIEEATEQIKITEKLKHKCCKTCLFCCCLLCYKCCPLLQIVF